MDSLEYDSSITYTKDKEESWKIGEPKQLLDYGGFSVNTDEFTKKDYQLVKDNLTKLKNMSSSAELKRFVPHPILNSMCVVLGWTNETYSGEDRSWVTEDTATFGVIDSIQIPMEEKIDSLTVGMKLLYLDNEGIPSWYSTDFEVTNRTNPSLLGETVVTEPTETTNSVSVYVPSDMYIAYLFDLENEWLVSLSI